MTERWVGLVTRDPVLYGELAAYLRDRKIPTVSLLPGQRVPHKVAVVVTSAEEASRVHFPRVLVARSGETTSLGVQLQEALHGEEGTTSLRVGIDPGPRPGYAVLRRDGDCLAEGTADSPEAVAALTQQLLRAFPRAEVVVRVGKGDLLRRTRTVNALLPLGVPVELVPEERTTLAGRRQNDPLAARAIAQTSGEAVREQAPLRITPGEIGALQRRSREMSGGKFTIPREKAAAVLEGTISIADAMRETAERLGLPRAEPRRARGRGG